MPTTNPVLLDTHALLWWQAGGQRLSKTAQATIASADELHISAITFWEIAMLADKGRISLDRNPNEWTRALLANDQVTAVDISPAIATTAGTLSDFHGDPADRLIYATAQRIGATIVTKDTQIQRYAAADSRVDAVW